MGCIQFVMSVSIVLCLCVDLRSNAHVCDCDVFCAIYVYLVQF